jgi:hypothetical protein
MKNLILLFVLLFSILNSGITQDVVWPLKAIDGKGDLMPVYAMFEDGTQQPVVAILMEEANHFMDVKVLADGGELAVKLLVSNDYYVPMKAIDSKGNIIDIKAINKNGEVLNVKGVSRIGNTVKVAAIDQFENYIPVKAVSPDGATRDIYGVKFIADNTEMELKEIKVMAHVKALPVVDITQADEMWFVRSFSPDGKSMDIVAINASGKEYPVRAFAIGHSYHMLNIKALSSIDIDIKVIKDEKGLHVKGIDEYGRMLDVKAKLEDGKYLYVVPGELKGNIMSIKVLNNDGKLYPVKAFSSDGHVFDVKGVKALNTEEEGVINGIKSKVPYHAHVKAFPPIK